jgi:hypothetical protein
MAIQDELSEEAKQLILTYVSETLRKHSSIMRGHQEVIGELRSSGYGVSSIGSERICLSKACVDEIMYILRTDFFN